MPAVRLSPIFNAQVVTSLGAPASGWKIHTYAAGSSTPLASYTDSTGNIAQSNPIIINALGFPENGQIWLQNGLAYKLVLTDAAGVVQKTEDNISGVNDSGSAVSQWQASGQNPTYISASVFTLPGDQTSDFHVGRRLQFQVTAGVVYGTIVSSVFTSLTTVTMAMDGSSTLDSGLSVVNVSILSVTPSAVPFIPPELSAADAGKELVVNAAGTGYEVRSHVGEIFYVPAATAPAGSIKSNGALLSRSTYAALWAYAQASGNISSTDGAWTSGRFSPGDGTTTFRIPDLRAEFIRGWDDGRGVDAGRDIGSSQAQEIQSHNHPIVSVASSGTATGVVISGTGAPQGNLTAYITPAGGSETRPANLALLACIRYQ